eukprot:bmy_14311T0
MQHGSAQKIDRKEMICTYKQDENPPTFPFCISGHSDDRIDTPSSLQKRKAHWTVPSTQSLLTLRKEQTVNWC